MICKSLHTSNLIRSPAPQLYILQNAESVHGTDTMTTWKCIFQEMQSNSTPAHSDKIALSSLSGNETAKVIATVLKVVSCHSRANKVGIMLNSWHVNTAAVMTS